MIRKFALCLRPHKPWRTGVPALLLLVSGFLGGCAGTPVNPEPPEVTVAGIRPVNLSLTEQKLMFRLRIRNPNTFRLPVDSVNFRARFSDQDVATGVSTSKTNVPAGGEGFMDVEVTTHLQDVMGQLGALLRGGGLKLTYALDGEIAIENRKTPFPFSLNGDLLSKIREGS